MPPTTTIYLCDYGIHSSLLLPMDDGRFVEYVYGDWAFAALNQVDPIHTLGAMLCSFQPALGRRFLTPKPGEPYPFPPNKPHTVTPIVVSADKEAVLLKQMDARYQRHAETALLNNEFNYGFTFVKDDEHYSVLHSCNHLTRQNLRLMGCYVAGYPIWSNYIVYPPGQVPRPKQAPSKLGHPVEN